METEKKDVFSRFMRLMQRRRFRTLVFSILGVIAIVVFCVVWFTAPRQKSADSYNQVYTSKDITSLTVQKIDPRSPMEPSCNAITQNASSGTAWSNSLSSFSNLALNLWTKKETGEFGMSLRNSRTFSNVTASNNEKIVMTLQKPGMLERTFTVRVCQSSTEAKESDGSMPFYLYYAGQMIDK